MPEVQSVLAAEFGGRPVNEQNLSEWKQGGYGDWTGHQEAREWAPTLTEQAQELEGDGDDLPLTDRLSVVATVALGRLLNETAELVEDGSPANAFRRKF